MGIDLRNTMKYAKAIEASRDEFQKWLREFLLKEAYRVIAQTKENTTTITGALRANWTIGDQKNKVFKGKDGKFDSKETQKATIESVVVKGNDLIVTVVNNMEYASYYEWGTTKMEGRYPFTRSIDSVYNSMPARYRREFKAWLKAKGVG
ncbi:HK97 gp10 family phage protein [Anaerosinus massiliensis]|uniref:HK97 gp10 family phage protein n=1 Tax=Massilibacillus massiliensis TaxID=1806837 RepID=UPI000DA62BFA|nr:HK97 gp10 family phage protein [Massilibacillus massiliensis]